MCKLSRNDLEAPLTNALSSAPFTRNERWNGSYSGLCPHASLPFRRIRIGLEPVADPGLGRDVPRLIGLLLQLLAELAHVDPQILHVHLRPHTSCMVIWWG